MKGNILGIFFTILSGVLIAFIIIAYGRSDRQAPEFRFSALNLVYDSKTEESDLIAGINAYDSRDGDLTSRIVVEKVVLNRDAETAVVYYAVADYSGNVSKQSRVFPADIADIESDGEVDEEFEDEQFPNLGLFDGAMEYSSAEGSSLTEGAEAEITQ
ncbi:MAG: hypothetical protein IJI01_02640 [Butyrivibrio sp.]|uniref:hypothetical protein n=1 Tax=Butyrivibrio sp. TaxID=28121 RepID=UPI0025BE08CA|nr:hypothetical protein [Butyrivibrio sp.]MBQ6587559.1 hypothetical protein [Butyrivibrio sp.]